MSEPSDVAPSVPPLPATQTGPAAPEIAVDLAAFLPEGTELVGADPSDPWDTGAPEPAVPAWALDDAPGSAAPTPGPAGVPVAGPTPAGVALDRIDLELDAVDDALVALDAGTPERSPLLRELLGY